MVTLSISTAYIMKYQAYIYSFISLIFFAGFFFIYLYIDTCTHAYVYNIPAGERAYYSGFLMDEEDLIAFVTQGSSFQ